MCLNDDDCDDVHGHHKHEHHEHHVHRVHHKHEHFDEQQQPLGVLWLLLGGRVGRDRGSSDAGKANPSGCPLRHCATFPLWNDPQPLLGRVAPVNPHARK